MSRTSRITRTLIAAGVLAVGSRAAAQTFPTATDCTSGLADPNCFHMKGSDTLFDIMTTAINNARAAGVPGAKNLHAGEFTQADLPTDKSTTLVFYCAGPG